MADNTVTIERTTLARLQGEEGDRAQMALECAWEVESIADALLREPCINEAENLWKRALLGRLRTLAGVVMDALDDDAVTLDSLRVRHDCGA